MNAKEMSSIKMHIELDAQNKNTAVEKQDMLNESALIGKAGENKALELNRIISLVRNQTGQDFSLYKKSTIYRRIERRMGIHQFTRIGAYSEYLIQNPHEINLLFYEMLIGVTNFFREPGSFEYLKKKVIPHLLGNRANERMLRIWIPGCSTGEEAYSVAIVIMECLEEMMLSNSFKIYIFATDINNQAIENARQGIYPGSISEDVSPERLSRYFIKCIDGSYQVKKTIREMVIFAPQNIIMDPPFIKLDMLCCRNLLIYFSGELQKRLMPVFHYSLNTGGILFLGSSESIGSYTGYFNIIESKHKIFERKETPTSLLYMSDYMSLPAARDNRKPESLKKDVASNIPNEIQQILMEEYTPPAVVINENGDIIYISGKTGRYLEPSQGKANLNIFAMARDEIKFELNRAVREAVMRKKCVTESLINVKFSGELRNINFTVRPLNASEYKSELFIVIFQDVMSMYELDAGLKSCIHTAEKTAAVAELEEQLAYTRGHLQSIIEEMETSQEELKSMNEELQSANEELQSTNEELKTSREELQSLNEELYTMNGELRSKNDELMQSSNDMRNLISNTKIATLFLDNMLNIRSFTPEMSNIISLIPTDVGRPVSDIVLKLKDFNLIQNAADVLEDFAYKELEVQHNNGCWYNVRIRPYRTKENIINGVVVTFIEITYNKCLEKLLDEANMLVDGITAAISEPVLILDEQFNIVRTNSSFCRQFKIDSEEVTNKSLFELFDGNWNIPELKETLEAVSCNKINIRSLHIEQAIEAAGCSGMDIDICLISDKNSEKKLILFAVIEMTFIN